MERDGAKDRKRLTTKDHAEGVYVADVKVLISWYDLGILPKKNTVITIGKFDYSIVASRLDAGMIALELVVYKRERSHD